MLVTDPAGRARLPEVLASPWMNKGYDAPADSHLVSREPLRPEELEIEVIRGMAGFEFGPEDLIEAKLKEILTSESYRSVLAKWEAKRDAHRRNLGWSQPEGRLTPSPSYNQSTAAPASSPSRTPSDISLGGKSSASKSNKRFSGFDFYRKKLFASNLGTNGKDGGDDRSGSGLGADEQPAPTIESLDPTRGFHPLISIYYLVREKLERERVYGPGHFASSELSLEGGGSRPAAPSRGIQPDYGMNLPRLTVPETSHKPGGSQKPLPLPRVPTVPPGLASPKGPSRDGSQRTAAPESPRRDVSAAAAAGVMQNPAAGLEQSHLEEDPSIGEPSRQRRSQSLSQQGPDRPAPRTPTLPSSMSSSRRPSGSQANDPQLSSAFDADDDAGLGDQRSSPGANLAKRFSSIMGKVGSSPRKASATSSASGEGRNRISESNTMPSGAMPAMSRGSAPPRQAGGDTVQRRASTVNQRRGPSKTVSGAPLPRSASKATYRNKWEGGQGGDTDEGEAGAADNEEGSSEAKPVYLKGLFRWVLSVAPLGAELINHPLSVATTSSKSVPMLRADIQRVLVRIGIQHRSTKAGFECVHVPSIDLSSVLSSEAAQANLSGNDEPRRPGNVRGVSDDPWAIEGMESSSGSFTRHAVEDGSEMPASANGRELGGSGCHWS